jgi:hypothetical protein
MKFVFLLFILTLSQGTPAQEASLSGKVLSDTTCSNKVMVWLSLDKENYQERLLLMHTEVPIGGTFRFYVKKGDYQIRASDEAGCEFSIKTSVQGDKTIAVKMVKK